MIDAQRIQDIFKDSLLNDNELQNGKPVNNEDVIVEGIVFKQIGLSKSRLSQYENEIIEMLKLLPEEFFPETGGGYSFMQMPFDKNGNQWGEQRNAEELLALALGIDKAKYLMPREMWGVLPGSMPYISINDLG